MISPTVRPLRGRKEQLRERLVREAAYFRAERRGFSPGRELDDWIAAEREVDQVLVAAKVAPVRCIF